MKWSLDRGLFLAVFFLFGLGLIQVYSSSFILGTENYGDGYYFFRKQAVITAVSMVLLLAVAYMPWKWLELLFLLGWFTTIAALVAVFIPGIGYKAGGASRWLAFGGFRLQPAEFYKILNIFAVTWLWHKWPRVEKFKFKMLLLAMWALPLVLILKQPDFGSFALIILTSMTLVFVLGLSWTWIVGFASAAAAGFTFLIVEQPYRLARISSFLDPWKDSQNKGFQVIQSLLSYKSGGIWGMGLGQGNSKLFFLPEAHTDFTLAVLGEELGFVGVVVVLLIFLFIALRGMQIAWQAKEDWQQSLAFGFIALVVWTVIINAGVTLGLLPTKGLALPFLSYGRSSLLAMSLGFGMLLNIRRMSLKTQTSKSKTSKSLMFE